MGIIKDISGQRFGKLVALRMNGRVGPERGNRTVAWECVCDCGNSKTIAGTALRNGTTKSCGCQRAERLVLASTTHGGSGDPLYRRWAGMKTRCAGHEQHHKEAYTDRDICVCVEWRDDFEAFRDWAMGAGYSPELTLERVNNDEGYSPSNCEWVSVRAQARNRRSNREITYNGRTQLISDWADELEISRPTLTQRLKRGWSVEDALNVPVTHKYHPHLRRRQ